MYVTLAQLADAPGAKELSEVASSERLGSPLVDATLFDLTLRGVDRSAYSPDEISRADEAKVRVLSAVESADELINAHLARRLAVPQSSVPGVLVRIARALVRYELHKNLIGADQGHPVLRDYRDALRLLESIRDGKVTLGPQDPVAANESTAGDVRFESSAPVFGRVRGAR
ncbi:MAG: DUF1320 domain-containing protein [Lysobacterales bacterium]